MAAAARVLQVVKPHVSMIKFPARGPPLTAATVSLASPKAQAPGKGTSAKGSGVNESALPPRYRRRPIDQVEMDYISRGGPE